MLNLCFSNSVFPSLLTACSQLKLFSLINLSTAHLSLFHVTRQSLYDMINFFFGNLKMLDEEHEQV